MIGYIVGSIAGIALAPVLAAAAVPAPGVDPTAGASKGHAYPVRPIRLIVPGAAGGTPDFLARIVQPGLSQLLGQQLVIDNRAGAGGMIGTELAARASPDGYTLLWGGPGSLTILPHFHKHVPFDPLADFAPIGLVSTSPMLLLSNPAVPARTVRELIALARSEPDKINYASFGVGNVNHLAMEQFKTMAAVKLTHVAYKGSPPATTDLLSGNVGLMFGSPPPVLDFLKTGRLRALGISSTKRSPLVPDVPTISEAGVAGYESGVWSGLLAPAQTPIPIIARLNDALGAVTRSPKVRSQFETQGSDPIASSPGEFAAFLRSESHKNAQIVKISGIKVD